MVECLVENGFMFSQKSYIFGCYIISVIFSPPITNFTKILIFLFFFLVSIKLTTNGRRHFKLFSNCHVSWDTLYKNVTIIS